MASIRRNYQKVWSQYKIRTTSVLTSTDMSSSADLDAPQQQGVKSTKLEYASDVHNRRSNKQNFKAQRTMTTNPPPIDQNVGSPLNELCDHEQANTYVQSQSIISPFVVQAGKDQEPWSTFTTRGSLETTLPDYMLNSNVTQPLSSLQTTMYDLQPDLDFFEQPWNLRYPNQDQPSSHSPPR
jgi:hypothetical protein